jgi:2-desacetyl-2-hydroxyethyl bacteriochlorophyllide A dehydrogenase
LKALVYHGPRNLEWQDWPEPQPGAGEALIAVRAVGICGSDLHGYTGESSRRIPPLVMGHEATGEVLGSGLRRVIVQPLVSCGACEHCAAGLINRCRERRYIGATMDGAMAERLSVPIANLVPLPGSLTFSEGTLTEPLAVAIHAVRQAGDLAGRRVLVAGCGPIGLLIVAAARNAGAASIVAGDVIAPRRDAALKLGATATFDPLVNKPGSDFDAAFDAVGIAATFEQALFALHAGGMLVAVGGWRTAPLDLTRLVAREIEIRGSFNFKREEFHEACTWLAERRIDAAVVLTAVHPLADGARVFADLTGNPGDSIKTVLRP